MTAAAKTRGPMPAPTPPAMLRPTGDGPAWPLEAVTRTFAILGQRGTGKSTAAADMVSDVGTFGTHLSVLRRNGLATVHGADVTGGDALYLSATADRRPQ